MMLTNNLLESVWNLRNEQYVFDLKLKVILQQMCSEHLPYARNLRRFTQWLGIFLNPQMDIRSSVGVASLLILGPLGTVGLSVLGSGSTIETYIYQT